MTRQKINKITAFQAADGTIFTSRDAYLTHERELAFGAKVNALVAEKMPTAFVGVVETGDGAHRALDTAGVVQLILDNVDALRDILNGKSSVKRTRRTKKQIAADKAAAPVEQAAELLAA